MAGPPLAKGACVVVSAQRAGPCAPSPFSCSISLNFCAPELATTATWMAWPSALEPGHRVVMGLVGIELRPLRRPGRRLRPLAVSRLLGRAGPMLLAEQAVECMEVGLDRGRDDVRAP